jgi:phosphomethylpyrimidine synthase
MVGLSEESTLDNELEKARCAEGTQVATIVDMTTMPQSPLRTALVQLQTKAVGTVPVYEISSLLRATPVNARDIVLTTITDHARTGVDFLVLHASLTSDLWSRFRNSNRVIETSSRGGRLMANYLSASGRENFFLEYLDDILAICLEYSMTISLAATFRPSSVCDALHPSHLEELKVQKLIVERCKHKGVGVHVELINHAPLDKIAAYAAFAKREFPGTTFGALGPSPTDIAVGFDDVVGSIGAAVAVQHGTSWITCTTAKEHCGLPTPPDLSRAIQYFTAAVHVGMIARGHGIERDRRLSSARRSNSWGEMAQDAIDPNHAAALFCQLGNIDGKGCSICGELCPLLGQSISRQLIISEDPDVAIH